MPKTTRSKFMDISTEKQKRYELLYEQMYQESIRTGQTPVPQELDDPLEKKNFLAWRHAFWVKFSGQAAAAYRQSLEILPPSGVCLAEEPSPYRSKS